MRGRHTLAAICGVLALLLALLVSGCGGSPEPKPPPKAEPSTSPSPSVTPPVMPAAAKEKTKAGAIAATRQFLAALKFAGATGNTSPFEQMYNSGCTRCAAITQGINETYDAGGSIEGGGWIPTRVKFYAIKSDIAYVDAVVDYEAQVLVKDAQGTKVTSPARKNVLKTFQLAWDDGQWRVGALDPTA